MKVLHSLFPCLAFALALGASLQVVEADAPLPNPTEAETRFDPHTPYEASNYAQAEAWYRKSITKNSLDRKTKGIRTLALTRRHRAFAELRKRYATAESPHDFLKYVVAYTCFTVFNQEDHVIYWDEWRKEKAKPYDALLWYYGLGVSVMNGQVQTALDVAFDEKQDIWLRQAAMEAIADNAEDDVKLQLLIDMAGKERLPKKGMERMLLLESCAALLMKGVGDRQREKYMNAFECLISFFDLDEKECPLRTKLVLARHLAYIYDVEDLFMNSISWRKLHHGGGPDETERRHATDSVPPPTEFMGMKANGNHIAYVIDASSSMLEPVERPPVEKKPEEKDENVTGKRDKKKEKKEEKKKKKTDKDFLSEEDLPWDKIKTRWDLAREYLKMSLHNLAVTNEATKKKEMTYTVIYYHTVASPFKSATGMIPAKMSNVKRTIAELDKYEPVDKSKKSNGGGRGKGRGGKHAQNSENNQGYTNLHGGMTRAFRAHKGGALKDENALTHVSEKAWETGCDTIFLLSDGAPNWDDFAKTDPYEPDVRVVKDVETEEEAPPQPTLTYQGPYSWGHLPYLVEDIRRLNRTRKAKIHCIGIGEANMTLMHSIAAEGTGKTKQVGVGG